MDPTKRKQTAALGLGALQKARIPPTKSFDDRYFEPGKYEALSEAMFQYIRDDKARGLADVEYAADMLKDQGFRPTYELGQYDMEELTGGDFGDVVNISQPSSVFAMDESGKIRELMFGDPNLALDRSSAGTYYPGGEDGIYKKGPFSQDSFDVEGSFLPNISISPEKTTFSRILDKGMEGVTENLSSEKFDELEKELYRPLSYQYDEDKGKYVLTRKEDAKEVIGHEVSHAGMAALQQHPLYENYQFLNIMFDSFLDRGFRQKVGGDYIDDMEHAIIYAMDEGSKIINQEKEPLSNKDKRNAKIFDTYMKLKDANVTSEELLSYFDDVTDPAGGRLEGVFGKEEKEQMLKDMFLSGEAVAVMALISKKMADELLAIKRERKRKGLPSLVSDSKSTHGHSHD
tara:strand:- start:411 stop:1616 length:1206 start_codon:yes stop_codon:yes gene_type:complete